MKLDRPEGTYRKVWPSRAWIALLVAPFAALMLYGATLDTAPWPIKALLIFMAMLALMAAAGSLITVKAFMDSKGSLHVDRFIWDWIPFGSNTFARGDVLGVALDTRMSVSTSRFGPAKRVPRYRIDLKLAGGPYLLHAGSDGSQMSSEARELARALGCPFEETGHDA